jgi:hypothetical protein
MFSSTILGCQHVRILNGHPFSPRWRLPPRRGIISVSKSIITTISKPLSSFHKPGDQALIRLHKPERSDPHSAALHPGSTPPPPIACGMCITTVNADVCALLRPRVCRPVAFRGRGRSRDVPERSAAISVCAGVLWRFCQNSPPRFVKPPTRPTPGGVGARFRFPSLTFTLNRGNISGANRTRRGGFWIASLRSDGERLRRSASGDATFPP